MLIHRDGRAGSETMGKTKVCPGPAGTLHFDSPIFCEIKTVFRLKVEWKLAKGQRLFENCLPLKFYFSKIFKMIVESSLIAHSIGNFILKNVITGHFLIKWIREEIWRHYLIFRDFVTSHMNKMLYCMTFIEVNYRAFLYAFTLVMWCSTSRRETRSL